MIEIIYEAAHLFILNDEIVQFESHVIAVKHNLIDPISDNIHQRISAYTGINENINENVMNRISSLNPNSLNVQKWEFQRELNDKTDVCIRDCLWIILEVSN